MVASRATIENSVSNDLRSTFIDSINVFDCRLSEVFNEYTEYVAKTIQNKGYKEQFTFFTFLLKIILFSHRIGGNRKRSYQWTNADQKLLQPVFSNAICRQSGD